MLRHCLLYDIPRVGRTFTGTGVLLRHTQGRAYFYGDGRTFTTYPGTGVLLRGRGVLLRHTRVGAQFNDIPGSLFKSDDYHSGGTFICKWYKFIL